MITKAFRPLRDSSARASAIAALFSLAPTAFANDEPARYAIQAEIRPSALSADGRFRLDATAHYAPEAKSADGRFVLKATNVPEGGCEAVSDLIFANGFQAP